MQCFYRLKKIIFPYSWDAVYGRIKEIIAITFFSSKKINKLVIEENNRKDHFFSIVTIIKDESIYIREWIEYHLILGVDHFYLYDNESNDNLHEIIKPYIEKGIVTYIFCPGQAKQIPAYNDAIVRFKENNHWMAFIDADEFIIINSNLKQNLPQFMNSYDNYDLLGVNWCMFDFNNHEHTPTNGYIISNYTRCFADDDHSINRHIKCIVKPSKVKICINPHYLYMKSKEKCVDEDFNTIKPPFTNHVHMKKIRINHYFSNSKEEFSKKISRGKADSAGKRPFLRDSYDFSYAGTKYSEIDLSSFIKILKEKIPETYR